jgi:hypothetical protein
MWGVTALLLWFCLRHLVVTVEGLDNMQTPNTNTDNTTMTPNTTDSTGTSVATGATPSSGTQSIPYTAANTTDINAVNISALQEKVSNMQTQIAQMQKQQDDYLSTVTPASAPTITGLQTQ